MKNLLVLTLILAPVMHVVAQSINSHSRVHSPQLERYIDNLPISARMLLEQFAGSISTASSETDNLSTELKLDSTITYSIEDFGGGVVYATPFERTEYASLSPLEKLIVESVRDSGRWLLVSRSYLMIDILGRVYRNYTELYDAHSHSWSPNSRLTTFHHNNSLDLIDSFRIEIWSDSLGQWHDILKVLNTFDVNDRLVLSLNILNLTGQSFMFKDVYHYDDDGKNTMIEEYLVDNGIDIPAGRIEFQYLNDLVVNETFSVPDGLGGFLPEHQIVYAYTETENVLLMRQFVYNIETASWILTESTLYNYDAEDHLEREFYTTYNVDEGVDYSSRTTYVYKVDEYLHYVTFDVYDFTYDEFIIDTRKVYYYEQTAANRDVIRSVSNLTFSPNPSTGLTEMTSSGTGLFSLYDNSGRMVLTQQLVDGTNVLDLSVLPAGIYRGLVRAGRDLHTGTIIKL